MLRTSTAALGAAALSRVAPERTARAAADQPNIIYIMADDLGYGDLGCYGQEQIQTPNIDRLAAEGTRFTQCYAGSTVCAPSRCALMTGQHTGHCFIRGNHRVPLRPKDTTVAQVLKGAGYKTGLVGKWGLGDHSSPGSPGRKGFDHFFGYIDQGRAHTYYPEYLWRNRKRVPLKGNVESKYNVAIERGQYSHDLMTEEALQFVRDNEDQSFFLYLAYTIPHANNQRRGEDGHGMEIPSYAPYEDRDWPDPQKGHAAMITRLDRDVGRLMDTLKELGLDENTLVLFTSDNGPHKEGEADPEFFNSSGPLKGYKRALYEGGIRVPMIARWPDKVPADATNSSVWAFWDILPTFAEIAGAKSPDGIDGKSQVKALMGEETERFDYLYWEFHERGVRQAIRWRDWKAIRQEIGKPIKLFNLAEDIGEDSDIAADHSDIIEKMETFFASARTPSEYWPVEGLD
jgi:arylsulfatase A-like enzyme